MRNSLADFNWITSHRSTFVIRPSSDTMTLRKRSRLIALGRVIARRLIIASRASCILILRSSDSDCALFDMLKRRDHRRAIGELQKMYPQITQITSEELLPKPFDS